MGRVLIGFFILFFGLAALFSILNMVWLFSMVVVPFLFILAGIYLWRRERKIIGGIAIGIGVMSLSHHLFNLDIAGLFVAALLIYFGYRLLKPDHRKEKDWEQWEDWELTGNGHETDYAHPPHGHKHQGHKSKPWHHFEDDIDREVEKLLRKGKAMFHLGREWVDHQFSGTEAGHTSTTYSSLEQEEKEKRKEKRQAKHQLPYETFSILGDFHMHYHRFELRDMKVTNGIGDVKIDLSKAVIPPGETTIEINALLGDIHIYVPYELEVSVQASVLMGEMDLLGHHQDGIARRFATQSAGYQQATKRVNIILSLGLGEIDVRYV